MSKTPEEIASEALGVFHRHLKETSTYYWYGSYADSIIRKLGPHFLAVVETALRQCPVPSPVSDDKLVLIEDRLLKISSHEYGGTPLTREMATDLRSHLDFIHTIIRSPEGEAVAAAWDAGHRVGWREGAAAQWRHDESLYGPEYGSLIEDLVKHPREDSANG